MQDAVTVTRALGIRYLWIDSLCIIQDSRDDWSREASKMSGIYRNAVVTIAADCSRDHSESIFTPSFRKRKMVNVWTDSSSWLCSLDYKMSLQEGASTLDTRGWILQEQLLSPRILKFCDGRIDWECLTSGSSHFKRALNGLQSTSMNLRQQVYSSWHQIVQSYSARILTQKTDKLMAVMGIANYTGAIVKDNFVAGLWEHNLWRDLLWTSTNHHGRVDFKFPTWSWVSNDGPVQYVWPAGLNPALAKLKIVTVSYDIHDHDLGTYGSLVLRASLCRVFLHSTGLLDVEGTMHNEEQVENHNLPYQRHAHGGPLRWSSDIPREVVANLKDSMWLVEIARDTYHHCLCVIRIDSGAGEYETFERVGVCRIEVLRYRQYQLFNTVFDFLGDETKSDADGSDEPPSGSNWPRREVDTGLRTIMLI